jgi:hypothetical protein
LEHLGRSETEIYGNKASKQTNVTKEDIIDIRKKLKKGNMLPEDTSA